MTDRELMQQALEALELLAWYENPATKVQVRKPRGGGPIVTMYPHKVATEAAAPLRERLAQPEAVQVSPLEFNHMTLEKEHLVGNPIFWAEWPSREQETVMAEYKFQTYAAYKTPDGEMQIGVVPDDAPLTLNGVPLYPRREWVGLTEEEKLHLEIMGGKSDVMLAEAIEAKLKERNQ